MTKKDEGHESPAAGKDPMDMTDEEFEQEKARLLAEGQGHTEAADDRQSSDDDKGDPDDTSPEDDKDAPSDSEVKPFTLVVEPDDPPASTEPKDEVYEEIVHNGQVHRLSKAKIIELAQKGFDYDYKIGNHRQLVQLYESDPGVRDSIQAYLRGKYQPQQPAKPDSPSPNQEKVDVELKPIDEFENPNDWFRENMTAVLNSRPAQQAPAQSQAQPPPPNPVETIANVFRNYDPMHANDVMPRLMGHYQKLSIGDSQTIEGHMRNGDFRPLLKFYDYVKGIELKPKQTPEPKPRQTRDPSFRMKPGGGEPPRKQQIDDPWALNDADFDRKVREVKGY